jgi:lysophospholipase L1-like esterase
VERALNQRGTPAQVINAGVRASDSGKLLAAYREALIKLKPDLLVVILAFNDQDGQALARNLETLVKLNRAAGIRTLLVAEPCNCDWGYVRENQAMMPALAKRLEVPLVQPQASLDKQVDDAFLWWDLVHLSDAGQAALAQELLKGGVEGGVERAVAEIVRLKGAEAPPEAQR